MALSFKNFQINYYLDIDDNSLDNSGKLKLLQKYCCLHRIPYNNSRKKSYEINLNDGLKPSNQMRKKYFK